MIIVKFISKGTCLYYSSEVSGISGCNGMPQKKFFFLVESPLRGGRVRCCPIRKNNFFVFKFVAVLLTTKPKEGGTKGLTGWRAVLLEPNNVRAK